MTLESISVMCPRCDFIAIDDYDLVDALTMDIDCDGQLLSFEGTIECQHCEKEIEVTLQYNPVYLNVE